MKITTVKIRFSIPDNIKLIVKLIRGNVPWAKYIWSESKLNNYRKISPFWTALKPEKKVIFSIIICTKSKKLKLLKKIPKC